MFNHEKVKIKNLHGYLQNRWMISICPMQIMKLTTFTKTTTIMASNLRMTVDIIVP